MIQIRSSSPYWLLAAALLGLAVGLANGAVLLAIHLWVVAAVGIGAGVLFVVACAVALRENERKE